MKKFLIAFLLAGVILPLLLTGAVLAQEECEDKVVVGESFTIAKGETFGCDLVVFGGDVTIEEGATVTRDVVVFGGDVEVAGEVKGDVVVFGGDVNLTGTAVVDGRLVLAGGTVDRAKGAVVSGGSDRLDFDFDFDRPHLPQIGIPYFPFIDFNPISLALWSGMEIIGGAVAMGLIALLVAAVWPEPVRRVSAALTTTPAYSGVLGMLTLIAGPVIIVVLAITIILSPIALLGALLYGMAIVLGWLALGAVVGERLALAFKQPAFNPTLATALGTLLVSLVMGIIGSVPCLGFIVQVVFAAVGVGAVVITRFGMRPYYGSPSSPAGPVAPTSSPPPPSEPPQPAAPFVASAPTEPEANSESPNATPS